MGTAVVTGASRGIGLELTRQLSARGHTVYATARRPAEAAELQALAKGGGVVVTELDVASPPSIAAWAEALKSRVAHVDLLVNNAGIAAWAGLDDVTAEEMLAIYQTNTIGPLLVTQQLRKQGLLGGREGSTVANVTSKMGSVDDNGSGGTYAYRASKAALNIINKSMSIDLAPDNVTCVLLHPGFVRTDMVNNNGYISAKECVTGLLAVLDSGKPLNGRWYDYAGKEINW